MDNPHKIGYDLEVLDRPGLTLRPPGIAGLQAQLCQLGSLCFEPLPNYQVFEASSGAALDDKIIVVAKQDGQLIAFLSTVVLPISDLDDPVIHTGLTVIHPDHRQSGVIHSLFAALFLHLFSLYPKGIWLSTLSRIITSLGHIATYTTNVFPSPQWDKDYPLAGPSDAHTLIAREINTQHREKMLILPEARFDEETFVFRAPKYTLFGPACIDDSKDPRYEHRNPKLTEYYRKLLQSPGDEVLQISYFNPEFTFEKGAQVLAKL
ncbi:hypothetical protein VM1G_10285 [Cytospora mali]|uniref:N-acetyltransferase domain-containing protein n=1 Tax=Cytospora mali TaxID=578113 RepID=A0A194VHJ3_CYTMA|nr:hypothetical protein VM1G_10285 [Valsa mali]